MTMQHGPQRRRPLSAWAAVFAGLLALSGSAGPASALMPVEEYVVKAAYLVNFAAFVRWPDKAFASARSPFVVCVAGEDPFGAAFEPFGGNNVDGRPLEVRLVASSATVSTDCQILFVASSEVRRLPEMLRELRRNAVLTVSDIDGFAAEGGMIQLFIREQKVRFEINQKAAEAAGLKIDARLLKLAEPAGDAGGEARR